MRKFIVKRYADRGGVEFAKELCEAELKEMLWKSVWKDEIHLEGIRWTVEECEDGIVEVTGEI